MERARTATNELDDSVAEIPPENGSQVGQDDRTATNESYDSWVVVVRGRQVERRGKPTNESYNSLVVEMGCMVRGGKPPTSRLTCWWRRWVARWWYMAGGCKGEETPPAVAVAAAAAAVAVALLLLLVVVVMVVDVVISRHSGCW